MSELKFRAYHFHTKKMYTNLIIYPNGYVLHIDKNLKEVILGHNNIDCIIMQSIGIYDKNNKEIYSGDIVKYRDDGNFRFEIIDRYIGFDGNNIPCSSFFINVSLNWRDYDLFYKRHTLKKVKIVGNIYENVKLLNKMEV